MPDSLEQWMDLRGWRDALRVLNHGVRVTARASFSKGAECHLTVQRDNPLLLKMEAKKRRADHIQEAQHE